MKLVTPAGGQALSLGDASLQFSRRERDLMGMPEAWVDWTAQAVRELPDDGQRYEVVDGELLVTPSPVYAHQRMVSRLMLLLQPHVESHALGDVVTSPSDVELDPRTLVQPDLFVTPLVDGRLPRTWDEMQAPTLVIEVLSPSTARADRHRKRLRYQRARIAEYWIVDLDARLVERWRPGDERPEVLDEALEWKPDPAIPPLLIELPVLFAEVLDR